MTKKSAINNVSITSGSKVLDGNLSIPDKASGIVLFVHGSGSSRFSPRNKYVAQTLQDVNIATLLFDLLTKEEEREDMWSGHLRFDIKLLANRLKDVTKWIKENPSTRNLNIGYFGASTGAAAALVAAADNNIVKAIVSRGGRPDLANEALFKVKAPTLLLVGEKDIQVIKLNEDAFKNLKEVKDKKLIIVPNATHLFEEPGTLEEVSKLALQWFSKFLYV
ncbi:MAG: dienelactone hydrolase family protein [Nitrososphaerales archaeon]